MTLLEMKNVSYLNEQDGKPVIDNVSIEINKGSVSAFLGKPGGGKSSALKLIAGLLLPDSGEILFEGKNIHELKTKDYLLMRKHTGFMFQDSALWANQDIFHNLELPLQTHFPKMDAAERKEKIEAVVKLVGYTKPLTLRPVSLSIGEQKRIGFARALIYEPDILFLDEPTESIDVKTISLFEDIIRDFIAKGNTLIYVSHDIDFINRMGGKKYYFEDGKIADIKSEKEEVVEEQEE